MAAVTQVALTTGASRGIGHATALALGAHGFSVFLAAEGTGEELSTAAAASRRAGAPDADFGTFDLGAEGQAEAMVATALERFGRVDVLVNNAGMRCRKPFGSFTR